MTSWFCEFIVIEFGLQEDWCFCNAFWMLKMQLHYVTSTLCWVTWKQRIALLHSLLVSKMKSILCMHYHSHFLYAFSSTFCITVNSSRWNWEGFCAEGANKTHHLLLRVFALQKWSHICTQYELICFHVWRIGQTFVWIDSVIGATQLKLSEEAREMLRRLGFASLL